MILCGVRLEVLLLVTMKDTVLWNVAPCNLVGTSIYFGELCCTFLWNACKFLSHYKASHKTRQYSSL